MYFSKCFINCQIPHEEEFSLQSLSSVLWIRHFETEVNVAEKFKVSAEGVTFMLDFIKEAEMGPAIIFIN